MLSKSFTYAKKSPHTYGVRPFARWHSFSTEPFSPNGLNRGGKFKPLQQANTPT